MNEDMSSKEQVHPLERSELDVEKERVAKEIANEISGKKSWRDWLPHFRSKQQIASAAGGFAAGAMSAAGAVNNPETLPMPPQIRQSEEMGLKTTASDQVETVTAQEQTEGGHINTPAGALMTPTEQESYLSQRNADSIVIQPEAGSALSQASDLFNSQLEGIDSEYGSEAATLRYAFRQVEGGYEASPYILVNQTIERGPEGGRFQLNEGSIIFQLEDGSFSYIEPITTADGQIARAGMVAMSDRLHQFLAGDGGATSNGLVDTQGRPIQVPGVGELVAMTYLPTASENVINPYSIVGIDADGNPVAFVLADLGTVPPTPAPESGEREGQTQPTEVADSAEAIRQMQERNAIDLENYNGQEYPNNPFPVRLDSEIEYNDTTITIDGVSYPRQRSIGSGTLNDGINRADLGTDRGLGLMTISGTYAGILGQRTLRDIDLYGPGGPVPEYHFDDLVVIDHLMVLQVDGQTYRFVFSTKADEVIFGHDGQGRPVDQVFPMSEVLPQLAVGRQVGIQGTLQTRTMDELVSLALESNSGPNQDYFKWTKATLQLIDLQQTTLVQIESGIPAEDDTLYIGFSGSMTTVNS